MIDIDIGESARDSLLKLPQKEKMILLLTFKKFYIASVTHLLTKIINLKTLKYFQCLSPEKIRNRESVRYIRNIANSLPLNDVDLEKLMCEWRLLQVDEEVQFTLDKEQRVDSYWSSIFLLKTSSNTRYPEIKKVVQATLSLAHGSADVERGFSKSDLLLTEDKAHMSERMLNAKLAVFEGLKKYNYMVHKVPIPNNLIKLAQNAHHSYQSFLENERLKSAEEIYQISVNDAESMQQILKNAIKSKKESVVVDEVMKSLGKFRQKEKENRVKVDSLKKSISKRKSYVVESIIQSKKQRKV